VRPKAKKCPVFAKIGKNRANFSKKLLHLAQSPSQGPGICLLANRGNGKVPVTMDANVVQW
jgi:hypothetical protein